MGLYTMLKPYGKSVGTVLSLWVFAYLMAASFALWSAIIKGEIGIDWAPILGRSLDTLFIGTGFVIAVAMYLFLTRQRDRIQLTLPSRSEARTAVIISASVLVLVVATTVVLDQFGYSIAKHDADPGGHPEYLLLVFIPVLLLSIPAEEALYRGAIQGRLRDMFSPAVAIGGSTALYAAAPLILEAANTTITPSYLGLTLVTIFLGLGAGIIYEKTGNIFASAAVHGIYDLLLVSLLYLSETGVVTVSPLV